MTSANCCVKDCVAIASIRQPLKLDSDLILRVPLCEPEYSRRGARKALHSAKIWRIPRLSMKRLFLHGCEAFLRRSDHLPT